MFEKYILVTTIIGVGLFSTGCASNKNNNLISHKEYKSSNIYNNSYLKNDKERVDVDNSGFEVKNMTTSRALKKLGRKYDIVFMLIGRNITLKNSNYKIETLLDLKKYISDTTDFKLEAITPTYKKNRVYKMRLVSKSKFKNKTHNSNKNCEIVLNKPMTVQKILKLMSEQNGKKYSLHGNASIPLNRSVTIGSIEELKKYLKKYLKINLFYKEKNGFIQVHIEEK
jgi:hypothetical protein